MDENKENKNRENEKKSRKKGRAGLLIALVLVCVFLAAAAAAKLGLFGRDISPAGSAAAEPTAEPVSETQTPAPQAPGEIALGTLQENACISRQNGTVLTETPDYACTDFLDVNGKYYQMEPCALTGEASICEYDEHRVFIRCALSDTAGLAQFEVSEEAKYLRVSVRNDLRDATVLSAITADSYMPNMNANDTAGKWRAAMDNSVNRIAALPPTMTIIDDDTSSVALVERYHAICEEMGVKGNYAVITSKLEKDETLKNLLLSYENEGYGMLFHCYSQTGANYFKKESRDLRLCEENYANGVRLMPLFGFTNYDYWVSPFGVNDPEMQDMCKRHGAQCLISTYNNTFIRPDGTTGDGTANRYNIPRCSLGHNAERYPNFSIEDLKAQIDACAAAHGWLLVTTHVNEWGNSTQGDDRLREVIRYAQERGFAFKTFAEAFEDRRSLFYLNELLDDPDYPQNAARSNVLSQRAGLSRVIGSEADSVLAKNCLAAPGDGTDMTGAIQSMLDADGVCCLGPGDFYVTGVSLPEGAMLCGSGPRTRLILSPAVTDGCAVKLASYSCVKDLQILGQTEPYTPVAETGLRNGIVYAGEASELSSSSQLYRSTIENVTISNFHGSGILCVNTGGRVESGLHISDVFVFGCDVGVNVAFYSEYHRWTNVSVTRSYFGAIVNGGNNNFENCDFSGNSLALLIDNSAGQSRNSSHGTFYACSFNHSGGNSGTAIRILGANNGEIFTGAQIFYGSVEIDQSKGVRFIGANMGRMVPITVTNSSAVTFSDCALFSPSASPLTESGNTALVFSNCHCLDGTAYQPLG